MSAASQKRRSAVAAVTQEGAKRVIKTREEHLLTAQIVIDTAAGDITILLAGQKVSTVEIGEWVRRHRALEAQPGVRAHHDVVHGDIVRISLTAVADFATEELANLSLAGSVRELVNARLVGPISDALGELFGPKPGQIVVPR